MAGLVRSWLRAPLKVAGFLASTAMSMLPKQESCLSPYAKAQSALPDTRNFLSFDRPSYPQFQHTYRARDKWLTFEGRTPDPLVGGPTMTGSVGLWPGKPEI